MRALASEAGVIPWDVCTHLFLFPFHPLLQHLSQHQPSLTYTFHGIPTFHIPIYSCLLFHTYIALHDAHLFPSFNIPFCW